MAIGRMFQLEGLGTDKQEYPGSLGPDIRYCMSGRCAIYLCLLDILRQDERRVAYVPAYTCETVLSSYEKAGYSLVYYDVDPHELRPRYRDEDLDQVSVFSLCGYYGFSTWQSDFIRLCKDRGITVLQDITHNPFQADPQADYLAGSLRKWMGIACGGIAIKRSSPFHTDCMPVDDKHLEGRYTYLEWAKKAWEEGCPDADQTARKIFWENELKLREGFDAFGSDQLSQRIIEHFPFNDMIAGRRKNYGFLTENLDPVHGWRPVFPALIDGATPSHLSIYADDRESFRSFLRSRAIETTVYWPVPPMIRRIEDYPGAKWIYEHICSIQIDQRYGQDDMLEIVKSLNEYSQKEAGAL